MSVTSPFLDAANDHAPQGPGTTLERRLRSRLDELRSVDGLRQLSPPAGIDLCSNDYLNLARDERLVRRFVEGALREGCGSTGSRLLRGERRRFSIIEQRFAEFKGAARALYFSSGYLANLAVLSTLPEANDAVFSDERNHASLIDGMRLSRARRTVFPHNGVAALRRLIDASAADVKFVVVESVFSMDGDLAPLREYAALCQDHGAVLVVDEAHAVGVYGCRGTGLIEESAIAERAAISINTAGKALGVAGAFVAGPDWAIEYLLQRARSFMFTTAPPPAVADALDEALTIVEREPERREQVRALSAHLRSRLRRAGLDVEEGTSQIVPLILGGNRRASVVASELQAAGFDVRAIRPPSVPPGTSRLRLSVNSALSEPVLDRLVDELVRILEERGSCSEGSS